MFHELRSRYLLVLEGGGHCSCFYCEKREKCILWFVFWFCVVCFVQSWKLQNPSQKTEVQVPSRLEVSEIETLHLRATQGRSNLPGAQNPPKSPKGSRNVVAVDLSASPDRYSRCPAHVCDATSTPGAAALTCGSLPARPHTASWLAWDPSCSFQRAPAPRRPDAAFLPRILTTLFSFCFYF